MSEKQFKEYFVKNMTQSDFDQFKNAIDLFANMAYRATAMNMIDQKDASDN